MKLVDRYILKGFLFSFAVVFLSMVALTVMVDMVVNVDEFLKGDEDGGAVGAWGVLVHIGGYYFYRIFEYFQWLCGPALLVGAAFAIARLNKNNELVALKASGVGVYRLLWPIIASGMVISALYVVNQELVIPSILHKLVEGRAPGGRSEEFDVRYVTDANNSLIYAPRYLARQRAMVAQIKYAADGRTILSREPVSIVLRHRETNENEFFIEADRATYDPARGGWALVNGVRWAAHKPGTRPQDDVFSEGEPISFYATELDPDVLARQRRRDFYRYLSFATISRLLRESSLINARIYEVAMHQHFAKPLLNLVILLLGLPFVVGQEGKSYFVSVMICIGLFVLVLGTEYVAAEFGHSGYIAPVLAAYLPALLFAPVAVLSLDAIRT